MTSTELKQNQTIISLGTKLRMKTENTKINEEIDEILDGIGDPVFVLDKNQVILRVNKATCELLRKKAEEIIGKHCYEVVHRTNHPFPGCPAVKALESKQIVSGEIEDSNLNIPLLVTTSPTLDDSGEVERITHTAKDVSKMKAAYHKIEVMNEKLHVLGSLTRHDVRNKLSAISACTYIIKKHCDKQEVVSALGVIEQAVSQSVKIFDFAKMYEQIGVEELCYIDVGAKIDEAYLLFSSPRPAITNECKGLKILADSFLRQLFYNFIDNTIKHGKKATSIKVHYQQNPKNLMLMYEDDGVGIPAENKSNLFKEGFSTVGSTGYGLFLTKKMMNIYGWEIEEKGEHDQGARFVITIPHNNKLGQVSYLIQK